MKSLFTKLAPLGAVLAVFLSVGSIGSYMAWDSPEMKRLGFDRKQIQSNLDSFPKKHCTKSVRNICKTLSKRVSDFLGTKK